MDIISPPSVSSSSERSSGDSISPITTSVQTSQSQIDLGPALLMEVDRQTPQTKVTEPSKAKKRRMLFDSLDPNWKRRSARVRNTNRVNKVEDSTNYRELLRKFLPSSILGEGKEDEQDDNDDPMALQIDIPSCDHTYGQSVPCRNKEKQQLPEDVEYLSVTEETSVKEFLEKHAINGGILGVYQNYLFELSQKSQLLWPTGLTDIYIKAFERWRKHINQPSLFCQEASIESIKYKAWITLVYHELKIDKWQNKSRLSSVSPSLGNARSTAGNSIGLGADFPGNFFYDDLDFLLHLLVRRDVFKEQSISFITRSLWQRAKFHILEADNVMAVRCIDKIATIISQEEDEMAIEIKLYIVNCYYNNVIALNNVQEKLESLERCQSLEEVHRLYDQSKYQRVVDLLKLTFTHPPSKTKVVKTLEDRNVPERHYQLLLLQDSLWKLEVYEDCLYWGEAAFNEALHQYVASASSTTTRDWAHTTTHLLTGLNKCLAKNEKLLGGLASGKLIRLTNNLIRVISLQMNSSEFTSETNICTLTPWMLLYRLIHHEEKKILSFMGKSVIRISDNSSDSSEAASDNGDLSTAMPSSLMLLFTAHDYLGRKSWCTCSDGEFLYLLIDVMMSEIKNNSLHTEDLKMGIEQCFYCLYGHPNKRTKVKYITEHNSVPVTLLWENSNQLFEYFQPDVLPEFDSYKTSTVSAELENLLRRILLLVPPNEDPTHTTEAVVAYIEGGVSKCPIEASRSNVSLVVKEIYYLLGDYYFKNKEFGKACKFYILDVAVNPDRLDSWAGMALSRSSQLEQKLTSSDLKNDTTVYRKSCSALRSFKRALELDPKRITLWIEYGSMAYMLHAYASRQLKQQTQLNLPEDILELLRNKREEMINTAEHCFSSANQCYEESEEPAEVWLHHYMLGKIAEKRQEEPTVFLDHYRLAAEFLHQESAKYPKRIMYHNPPELSIESLECYYRLHTSIIKYLMRLEHNQPSKETMTVLFRFIKIAENSPFANYQEQMELESTQSSDEEEIFSTAMPKKIAKKRGSANTDHNYVPNKQPRINLAAGIKRPRQSQTVDSSSESDTSAAVKDLLNSLIAVVSERCDQALGNIQPKAIIVLGDEKVKKTISRSQTPVSSPQGPEKKPRLTAQATIRTGKERTAAQIELEEKFKLQSVKTIFDQLVQKCLAGIFECQQRFSQHYKSLYRLAHYYCYSKLNKNLQKSRDILLGGASMAMLPCLFGERKNTNFFNGIWRIPIDEIERPGSFTSHMFRSIVLLIDVLRQLEDQSTLAQLTIQLHRTPDPGKKYLRDTDRLHLSREAFTLCIGALRDKMNGLLLEEPPPEESRLISCLMEIHKTWQTYQKAAVYPQEANDLLEEAYTMYKFGEVDASPPVLEQAMSFCQSCQQQIKAANQQEALRTLARSTSLPTEYTTAAGLVISDGKAIQDRPQFIQRQVSLAEFVSPPSTSSFPLLPNYTTPGQDEFTKWYYQFLLSNNTGTPNQSN